MILRLIEMVRFVLTTFILTFLASRVTSQQIKRVGDFRLLYYNQLKTYGEAEAFCKCRDGWVAEPRYKDIQSTITSFLTESLWIGLTYSNDGWRWGDGNPIKYSNWAPNQNTSQQRNCSYTSQRGWTSVSCLERMRFACQFDTTFEGNYELKFIKNSRKNYTDAIAACKNAGSQLVNIKNSVLNQQIKKQIPKLYDSFFTSGNDITTEASWKWGDGCEFDEIVFDNWLKERGWVEPTNTRKENCLAVINFAKLQIWYDIPCSGKRNYVCQKDVDEGNCNWKLCSQKGKCTRRKRRYSCECDIGRYGPKCKQDHCVPSPCKNSGTCQPTASYPYYNCTCPPEYTGPHCSELSFVRKDQCDYHVHENRNKRMYYDNAAGICKNLGGVLGMVKTSEIRSTIEMQMVKQYGLKAFKQFWIGAEKVSDTWQWLDGIRIPETGPNQSWARKSGVRVIMSSWRSKMLNDTLWFGKHLGEYVNGFVCEKAVGNPCDEYCLNNGTCEAIGCYGKCECSSEYFGKRCENKKIQLLNLSTMVGDDAEKINITCRFDGTPVPEVKWVWRQNEITKNISTKKNKNFVLRNNKMSHEVIGSLIIQHREFLNLAEIGCFAENDLTSSKIEYTLPNSDMHFGRKFAYRLRNYSRSHSSASLDCESVGWKLLQVVEHDTQQAIARKLSSWNVQNDVYIDLQRRVIQNSVVWVQSDGSLVYNETAHGISRATIVDGKYVAWGSSQPSPFSGDCVAMKKSEQWRWSVVNCSHLGAHVCQRPVLGPMKTFHVEPTECKAELVVNFTSGDLVNKHFHLLEIIKNSTGEVVHDNYALPRSWGNGPVLKYYQVENETTYSVKVSVCPNCPSPYNTSTQVTTDALVLAEERPISDFNVTQLGDRCALQWDVNTTGVIGYKITTIENLKVKYNELATPVNTTEEIPRNHETFLIAAKPNSAYVFSARAKTCYGFGPESFAQGVCETDTAAPQVVPTPRLRLRNKGNKNVVPIEVPVPDQRNGPISCIFVIVTVNATINDTTESVGVDTIVEAGQSSFSEILSRGEKYLALAIRRGSIMSEALVSGILQRQLGNGSATQCDMSNVTVSYDNARKKRSLSLNITEARNRRLDGWTNYSFIVVTTTPGESNIYVKASAPVRFSLQHPVTNNGTISVATVVGILLGISVVLIIIFIAVIVRHRRASKTQSSSDDVMMNIVNGDNALDTASEASETKIPLDNLLSMYNGMLSDNSIRFQEQYSNLKTEAKELNYPTFVASTASLKEKNRYKNVIPADHSRVVIGESEYINASYIHGFQHENRYIATQGPLPSTIEQFWLMVLEQKSTVIVMLTRCVERKKKKCAQYWPANESVVSYGTITVQNRSEEDCGSYVIRTLTVGFKGQTRTVKQVHFVAWPDHGVPATTSSLLDCHKAVSKFISDAPIIVHCSAGVGRSGAFIAYDILKSEGDATGSVDVYKCIMKMRENRIDMVQTVNQYILIHKLLVENHLFGETSWSPDQLLDGHNWEGVAQKEFNYLSVIGPLNHELVVAKNPASNRSSEVIPYRRNHVTIVMKSDEVNVPYINASYIEAYNPNLHVIATQGPLDTTRDMLWRCVLDNNVKTILSLTSASEDYEEQSAVYWPEGEYGSVVFGDVTVQLKSMDKIQNTICRHLDVCRNNESQSVVHFQYLGWRSQKCPEYSNDVLDLVQKLSLRSHSEPDASVLIHCSDGAGRTGAFCTILNLVMRFKATESIDVFRAAKDVRDCRPKMVQTLEQYQFCYRTLVAYVRENGTYVNTSEKAQSTGNVIYENLK